MSMPTHHLSDELLFAYAAGTCTEAESLLVASHLTLCPLCRHRLEEMEAVGGALLEEAEPEPVGDMLADIFARIDREEASLFSSSNGRAVARWNSVGPVESLADVTASWVRS